jgi:hypothetical protein
MFDLESEIRAWKSHLYGFRAIHPGDVLELESHLRDSIDELMHTSKVSEEEAFLLAVRRLGDSSVIGEEFAKISTEDVWKQLLVPSGLAIDAKARRRELLLVICLAFLGGLLSKVPSLFGYGDIESNGLIYARNAPLMALFPVALYLFWKHSLPLLRTLAVISVFPLLTLVVNLYPSLEPHHTSVLSTIHLPILLLYVLIYFYGGPAYPRKKGSRQAGTGWRDPATRLNFVRFAGETFIFSVLIGLGGIVLILLTAGTFELIEIDIFKFIQSWIAPFGFFGLFPVAVYLVGQKKSLIESIAPVLARIFTPLFLVVLISLIIAFVTAGQPAAENRSMLIWFDIILALSVAMTLYSMSSKEAGSQSAPSVWDVLSFALIIAAVIVDLIALSGVVARLSSYGFTPNKSAAIGENIILLINLVLLTIGYVRYLFAGRSFESIVTMQMRFLSVYAVWAAFVLFAFPPLFGFR